MALIPSSLDARIILSAISPRFAIKILEITRPIFLAPIYKFMLPCFLNGLESFLFANASSEWIIIGLVSAGSNTASMIPFSAAMYGLANLSRNSLASFFLVVTASRDCFKSLLCIIVMAASGPRTAISAVGHAQFKSVPKFLLPIAIYAPPYALPTIQVILGIVASQYA